MKKPFQETYIRNLKLTKFQQNTLTSFFWIFFLFILFFIQLFICLNWTAVFLLLQDVADKDTQKPQHEEERHQKKGNILWVTGVPITIAI